MSGFRLAVASGQQLVVFAGLPQEYLALRGMHAAASASSVATGCVLFAVGGLQAVADERLQLQIRSARAWLALSN